MKVLALRFRTVVVVAVATVAFGSTAYAATAVPLISTAGEASEPAERVWPPADTDGPIFPIETAPDCQLVNGFGGYSKATGSNSHAGIDIGATEGQEVYAVESGLLYEQIDGPSSGLGWGLLTANDDKYRYFHLSAFADDLTEGTWVNQGDVIGYVGDTGNASAGGYHLHFEYRPGPKWAAVNPYPFLTIPDDCKDYIGK